MLVERHNFGVSVVGLVYKSVAYAKNLCDQLQKIYQDVEIIVVANRATDRVLDYLELRGIPYIRIMGEHEPDSLQYDPPEYIKSVYEAWNVATEEAKGDTIVYINSDHKFFYGWLEELKLNWRPNLALSCLTIEPGHPILGHFQAHINGTGSIQHDCGRTLQTFDFVEFRLAASRHKKEDFTTKGGVYMPTMVDRKAVLDCGGFPLGNPKGTFGDRYLFERLAEKGIEHKTCWSSICYHLQQGEMEDRV